jgi:hypothetical protein
MQMPNGQVNGDLSNRDDEYQPPTRRNFLRRTGIIGAVTAAVIGGADLAGVSAHASVKSNKRRTNSAAPDVCCISYTWAPDHCNGGKPCPGGQCCFHAVGCDTPPNTYACLDSSSCADFTRCI